MLKKCNLPKELKRSKLIEIVKVILYRADGDQNYPTKEVAVIIKGFKLYTDDKSIYIVNGNTEDLIIECKNIFVPANVAVKPLKEETNFCAYGNFSHGVYSVKGAIRADNNLRFTSCDLEWIQLPANKSQNHNEFYRLPLNEQFGLRLPTIIKEDFLGYDSALVRSLRSLYSDKPSLLRKFWKYIKSNLLN